MKDLIRFLLLIVAMTAIAVAIAGLTGCNGIDINAKIRPSIPGKPDQHDQTKKPPPPPAQPPKPDPYDWEPWWNRPPKSGGTEKRNP